MTFVDHRNTKLFEPKNGTAKPDFREGNGKPLQFSCLENLMDRGAWQATVHGVTKSQTRLSNFAFTFFLLHTHITPKEQGGLSPYEMLFGRPFIYVNDLVLDPQFQTPQSYAIGNFQPAICLWGVDQDPEYSKKSPLYAPGTQVLIKVWKNGSLKAQLHPTWKGPYPVILSTPRSSQGTRK